MFKEPVVGDLKDLIQPEEINEKGSRTKTKSSTIQSDKSGDKAKSNKKPVGKKSKNESSHKRGAKKITRSTSK